jgi:hypothetical protein
MVMWLPYPGLSLTDDHAPASGGVIRQTAIINRHDNKTFLKTWGRSLREADGRIISLILSTEFLLGRAKYRGEYSFLSRQFDPANSLISCASKKMNINPLKPERTPQSKLTIDCPQSILLPIDD